MDRGNTKQEILDVALELFSRQGYEATSISSIADAVGIRKASLYSHFSSKQAILDEIVKIVLEKYDSHSFVLKKGMDNMPKNCDEAVAMIKGQIHYIANDPLISKARKMLTIEQFFSGVLSILVGIGIGGLTSKMFVPMLQNAYAAANQILPMQLITDPVDMYRLFGVIAGVMVLCLFTLILLVFKMNVSKALKLGEE